MELDPYWKWLGIPPDQQPPDHYALLGIARFETDEDVIENAAVRQMNHVRSFQGGQHAVLSQQLLNELSIARLCLLNDEQKRDYDQQLQGQQPAGEPDGTALPVATLLSPAAQLPVAQEVVPGSPPPARTARKSRRRSQKRHAKDAQMGWIIALAVVAVLLICILVGVFLSSSQEPDKKAGENSKMPSIPALHLSLASCQCHHTAY